MATPDPRRPFPHDHPRHVVRNILDHLGLVFRLERKLLGIIASSAMAIGLFMLCVPIAVQA